MAESIQVIGIGGSLRAASTSRTALATALDGASESGARSTMIWVRELRLRPYSAEHSIPLDWLILLAERDPPYLSGKPIGLVATAGGTQGLQAVNSMDP